MPEHGSSQFNVLVIMSDQHSRFHLGCNEDGLVRTPHLDRLAAEGIRFTNAYCASPICVPSRMSFMTSRWPSANRVWTNDHILSSSIPTWAHAMGAAGYETAIAGQMHFIGPDQRHGFERRLMGSPSALYPGADWQGGPRFRKVPLGTLGQGRISAEVAGYGRTYLQTFDEQVTETTCSYLEEKAEERERRPFALVAGCVLPHCPYFSPTRELFEYYYDRVDVPQPTPEERQREPAAIRKIKRSRDFDRPVAEERIRVARAAYFGMCEYFDSLVGRMLNKLKETGLDRETLVIYCSDHGEMAGEHGLWSKSNYYEAAVSVPLIARLPGVIPAGVVNERICNLVDLGPTMVEMGKGMPMPTSDGRSMWPMLCGDENVDWLDETFSELGMIGDDPGPSRMIRSGPWKLYTYQDSTLPILFNLEEDPQEMTDLASDPRYEEVRCRLLERIHDGWDPDLVLKESAVLDRDMQLIANWGKAAQPLHEDNWPVPDVEDVVFR